MAVKIRLKRMGKPHHPCYRIVVTDSRNPRDGASIETLGLYHPLEKEESQQLRVNLERARYWLSVGAQPTETVEQLLKRVGIAREEKKRKKPRKRRRKSA